MNSTSLSECLPYAKHLDAEHRRIQAVVEQIQASYLLDGWPHTRPDDQERTTIFLEQLRALRDRLRDHFEEEKTGGCIEEAVSRAPNLGSAAAQLEREHSELLSHLTSIDDMVRSYRFSRRTAPDIELAFNDFAEILYDHETDENRILEQGFNISADSDL